MRLPVVMAHEAVNEGQCIDFLAQPPQWSAEGIGWRPSLERRSNNIELNPMQEVTQTTQGKAILKLSPRLLPNSLCREGRYQNPTRIGVAGWRGRGRRTKMRSRAAGDRVRG